MPQLLITVCAIIGAAYCVRDSGQHQQVEMIKKECQLIHDGIQKDWNGFYAQYCNVDGSLNESAIVDRGNP